MTTIRLLDARRGLNRKCEELFGNAKIAEAIYRFLCDGIEECEDAGPERKKGNWVDEPVYRQTMDGKTWDGYTYCSVCKEMHKYGYRSNYCPNCGADMRGEQND